MTFITVDANILERRNEENGESFIVVEQTTERKVQPWVFLQLCGLSHNCSAFNNATNNVAGVNVSLLRFMDCLTDQK